MNNETEMDAKEKKTEQILKNENKVLQTKRKIGLKAALGTGKHDSQKNWAARFSRRSNFRNAEKSLHGATRRRAARSI